MQKRINDRERQRETDKDGEKPKAGPIAHSLLPRTRREGEYRPSFRNSEDKARDELKGMRASGT
ncbi:hypothetical protein I79_020826 [Cricetulus griseus]|uniref:Uncharacterized protein n=1 Tax=Cricetulus griseus TaxID=10029 RepID=G3IB38_CRIGR|nr:hypothetical protein I79_020826 [Cricetulus griseus]